MNLDELVRPYSEDNRTVEGQIKWLQGKGIPQDHIDKAILAVYDEVERGKVFKDGDALDQELLKIARGHHHASISEQKARLESFFNHFKDQWLEEMSNRERPGLWQRIKAVFKP